MIFLELNAIQFGIIIKLRADCINENMYCYVLAKFIRADDYTISFCCIVKFVAYFHESIVKFVACFHDSIVKFVACLHDSIVKFVACFVFYIVKFVASWYSNY